MDSIDQEAHCYAVRRLNPFRGTLQILATSDSRAISPDGTHWELQIRTKRPDDMWGAPPRPGTERFLRLGIWDRTAGLRKVPANPLLDLSHILPRVEQLIDLLRNREQEVPFPLADRFELWLLDEQKRLPLALLAASTRREHLITPPTLHWHCAERTGDDHNVPTQNHQHPSHSQESAHYPDMSALERMVMTRAGHSLAQWFEREPSGTGRGLPVAGLQGLDGRQLDAGQFPSLLLQSHWNSGYQQRLVADYLAWLAPWLLTLPHITDRQREKLERQAMKRAILVDRLWQLYPRIIDQGAIDTARVESRLRNAG